MFSRIKKIAPNRLKIALVRLYRKASNHQLRQSLDLLLFRKTPVIVYQMGKVGSSSIWQSLLTHQVMVYHCHSLNMDHLQGKRDKGTATELTELSIWVYEHIVKPQRRAKYITLVREPIELNISRYFQNIESIHHSEDPLVKLTLEELCEDFIKNHSHSDYALEWFDKEIQEVLGIDVYDHPFPHEVGYQVIKNKHSELLILRTDTPDPIKEAAIKDFVGLTDFSLATYNVGEDKKYSPVYRAFKAQIHLPADDIDKNCQSRLMRHFFLKEEVDAVRAKWLRMT